MSAARLRFHSTRAPWHSILTGLEACHRFKAEPDSMRQALVASVCLAVSAPIAFAQSSGVQVYGKLYPFLLQERGSGASAAGTTLSPITNGSADGTNALGSTTGMASGNSRFGFRGSEDLGSGLRAIWQIESLVVVDHGGGQISGRDSYLGLASGFGTLRLGNMDTIFKEYGDTLRFLGVSSGTWMSSSDMLRKVGFGTSSASSFHLRRPNSAVYESPRIAGLQLGAQWSSNEAKTATRDPQVLSLGLRYDAGPLYLAIAHEIHDDLFGGSQNAPPVRRNTNDPSVNSRDQATQATIEYRFGKGHRIEFDVIRKDYKENTDKAGRFRHYTNNAFMVAIENRWGGGWRTALSYVKSLQGSCDLVDAGCSTDGLDGSKITAGAAYYLSARTYLFGAVGRLVNGYSARFSSSEFGNPNPGEDLAQASLGISHSF